MKTMCAGFFWLYVAVAALALVVALISTFGLFGVQRTPLGTIFAVMLAQPWLSIAPKIGADSFAAGLALICVCLVLNAAILRLISWLFCNVADRFF